MKPDLIWQTHGTTSRLNREARFDAEAWRHIEALRALQLRVSDDETAAFSSNNQHPSRADGESSAERRRARGVQLE